MRLVISFLALSFLGALVQSGCNSADQANRNTSATKSSTAPVAPVAQSDGVRRVTVAELKDLLAKNEVVVIDVRNQSSYDMGHIRGARLIPEGEVAGHSDELPKDKLIVTYCS